MHAVSKIATYDLLGSFIISTLWGTGIKLVLLQISMVSLVSEKIKAVSIEGNSYKHRFLKKQQQLPYVYTVNYLYATATAMLLVLKQICISISCILARKPLTLLYVARTCFPKLPLVVISKSCFRKLFQTSLLLVMGSLLIKTLVISMVSCVRRRSWIFVYFQYTVVEIGAYRLLTTRTSLSREIFWGSLLRMINFCPSIFCSYLEEKCISAKNLKYQRKI